MLLQLGRFSTVKLGHRCCRAAGAARGSGAHCIVTATAEVTIAADVAPECPGCCIAFSNELAMCTAVQARHCMHAAQQWARPSLVGAHALGALYRCHILVLQKSVLRRHFAAACVHGGSCCMPKLPCSALCRGGTDTTEFGGSIQTEACDLVHIMGLSRLLRRVWHTSGVTNAMPQCGVAIKTAVQMTLLSSQWRLF